MSQHSPLKIIYPNNKDFVFTIFDDTDVSTLEYIKPIYEYLESLNMKITKSVWPLSYKNHTDYRGSHTLEDIQYADYIKLLNKKGFEIGFHGPSMASSQRHQIEKAFDVFYDVIGSFPRIYAPHSTNKENLYWGSSRFSFNIFQKFYKLITHENKDAYQGHIKNSPNFWGDLSLKYIEYTRNFTYNDINLLNINAPLPYKNRKQPFVKNWFYSCDADNVEEFNLLIKEKNQDRLETERGVCIISTHLGKGFNVNGDLHPKTKKLLKRISKKNGLFIPVSDVLDFLKLQYKYLKYINKIDLFKLELKWFWDSYTRRKNNIKYNKTEIDFLS